MCGSRRQKIIILVGSFVQYFLLCGACDFYGISWYFTVVIGTFSVPFGALWRFWYMFVVVGNSCYCFWQKCMMAAIA